MNIVTGHRIAVDNLDNEQSQFMVLRVDMAGSGKLYLSSPTYALLTEDQVRELALACVEFLEHKNRVRGETQ